MVAPLNALEHFFLFCLQVFCQAELSQLVDCLAPIGNERKMFYQTTQQRIAILGIEPGVSNLSITNPTGHLTGN